MLKSRKAKLALILLLCLVICVLILLCITRPSADAQMVPLKVSLLKVGKADAIVLQCQEAAMVIDTGEEDDGEELVTFLKNQGITRIETLIITHFDRDHVGGADTLVDAIEIGRVLLPGYKGDSSDYLDFMDALNRKGLVAQELTEPMEFKFMEATVRVEPPLSYETDGLTAENDNNFSLITTVVHGENCLLFTGDAEKQRIRQWLSNSAATDCDFLKVPHHGVYNTALEELLQAVTPEYAVICSSHKHPADDKTLELLKETSIQTFQTKDGNVTVISDGRRLEIKQALEH